MEKPRRCLSSHNASIAYLSVTLCLQSYQAHVVRREGVASEAPSLPYERFVAEFMAPNRPVVIKGAASGWPAEELLTEGAGGAEERRPSMAKLAEACGGATVRVTTCHGPLDGAGSAESSCEEMSIEDFAAWWRGWEGAQGPEWPRRYLKASAGGSPPVPCRRLHTATA